MIAPPLAARWLQRLFLTPRRLPAPPREIEWLSEAEESRFGFGRNQTLPLFSWGNGPVVLLAHGWSGRGSQLAAFSAPLVKLGFRVVAFDAPGHGKADGNQLGLPEMAEVIAQIGKSIGPIHAIVAHSLGTAATTIALSSGLDAERLVYIAPPENPGDYLYRVARYLGFGDRIALRTQKRMERRFNYPFALCRGSALAPSLDVPLLIIHDRGDRDVPHDEGVRLAAEWAGARLLSTEGLGHNRILRNRKVIEAATEFVNSQPVKSTCPDRPHEVTDPQEGVSDVKRSA
jgi:pimeloyl-ACP methyl ester carboxylesterase